MIVYTNEDSLKAQYGDDEASGLMTDVPGTEQGVRLNKAAETAASDIDQALAAAGYLVPIPAFTLFGEFPDGVEPPTDGIVDPPYLHAKIQWASDCLVAYYLAASTDLQKKRYDEDEARVRAWFKDLKENNTNLPFPVTADISGKGQTVVLSRERVFTKSMPQESVLLRRSRFRNIV